MTRLMWLFANGLRPQPRDRLPACSPLRVGPSFLEKITKNHFTPTSVEVRTSRRDVTWKCDLTSSGFFTMKTSKPVQSHYHHAKEESRGFSTHQKSSESQNRLRRELIFKLARHSPVADPHRDGHVASRFDPKWWFLAKIVEMGCH